MVDINFGCPARVVCGKACGSAVMRDPKLAGEILKAVAGAVSVPVSVKMRTGWDETMKTAVEIARRAQNEGFALVTVHGRTRAQRFSGTVNRADIAEVVRSLTIPVLANGDVTTPQQARAMLEETGAAGVMIGRGCYGNPWLFERAQAVIDGRDDPGEPTTEAVHRVVREHLTALLEGEDMDEEGRERALLRTFRKHLRWYLQGFCVQRPRADAVLARMMRLEEVAALEGAIEAFFDAVPPQARRESGK